MISDLLLVLASGLALGFLTLTLVTVALRRHSSAEPTSDPQPTDDPHPSD